MTTASKKNLIDTLLAFQASNFYENGINLFKVLGYNTARTISLSQPTYQGFNDDFKVEESGFIRKNALVNDWQEIQLLFQLTTDEMVNQLPAFKPTVERDEPASFLFFAIELTGENYSRTQLAAIAREMNKPFPMDVFLLFKYGNYVTLSLIERRPNKKFYDRDVVEKVTHIYNISIKKPHAGHIHILNTFSFETLSLETKRKRIEGFKDLQTAWKKAVSTQLLNKQFYKAYSQLSKKLINAIHPKQIDNKLSAHQGVLNLLNRIMFIYFVQKKKWIMNDEDFIIHFWEDYLKQGHDKKNIFHEKWLNSVFFSAFNGKAYSSPKAIAALPEPYKSALIYFPYLNGGLFSQSADYDYFLLTDDYFHDIFNFFEGYIFTITEDTPYDVNLEINPELLGKMYEGMINATDLDDVDAENGIVYTERPEINFMVRRSLVEVLDKKLNSDKVQSFEREFLYHFIFDTLEERLHLLKTKKVDVQRLRNAVATLTACDPACGSGSMLLGVIMVQMEMLRAIDEYEGSKHTSKDDFTIKKQLISECIYGVDVKEWAVRIAELRLWLYMISEAEFTNEELVAEPLLPNLDFKLRSGNSLLQKFGELDFTIKELLKGKNKSAGAAKKLNDYIKRKKAFIQNQAASTSTYENLKDEGRAVFIEFIRDLIAEKEQGIHNRKVKQATLFGGNAEQRNLFEEQSESLSNEIEQLKVLRSFILKEKRLPFSYDIDFMEVFIAKETDPGFDLIIGNPPYVRQEEILPPEDAEYLEKLMKPNNKGEKAKVNKAYKEELNSKVYKTYPYLATCIKTEIEGKNKTIPVYGNKVPGRSDLYVYFQLLCPAYLNSKGTFCFIISNSWLDVEFGAFIQHFLLKHTRLQAVYDCTVRSFEAAVNTIIYLHSAVQPPALQGGKTGMYKLIEPVDNVAKFIMNKVDYTQAAYAPLLIDQESCNKNEFNDIFRLVPVSNNALFHAGYDKEEQYYIGDKWGGKYLKAPEIYYKILEKGQMKLKKLKQVSNVAFGVKTGANDFFILDRQSIEKWQIEMEFLIPFLTSPKDSNSLKVSNKTVSNFLFYCNKPMRELNKTRAIDYIRWGEESEIIDGEEKRAFHLRPSCKGRKIWYSIGELNIANLNCNYMVGSLMKFFHGKVAVVNNFHEIHCNFNLENKLSHILNSTLTQFFVNVMGRKSLGDGLMKIETYEASGILIVDPDLVTTDEEQLKSLECRTMNDIFIELGFSNSTSFRSQKPNPLPDRKALDDIVFDELGLTKNERNEVYWSVAELVKQRLDKAASR